MKYILQRKFMRNLIILQSLDLNQLERLRSLTSLENLKTELERLGLNLIVRLGSLSILIRIKCKVEIQKKLQIFFLLPIPLIWAG